VLRVAPIRVPDSLLESWLAEDVGDGDVTTDATVPSDLQVRADLLFKAPGVVCGLPLAEQVFTRLDPDLRFEARLAEGTRVDRPPVVAASLEGRARAVLTGERLALNLVGRLSGIATLTARYADAVAGTHAAILDTRKTTPGLRLLEKYAVACGGGQNHRIGLFDAVLIKDNHIAVAGSVGEAVRRARAHAPGLELEVEADTLAQVEAGLEAGADVILLDNMPPQVLAEAVALVGGRARTEASGGVNLDTVAAVARSGVDMISIGALTHAAASLDVSLEVGG
jgi:nicotinate-nucleotide pyrophosphorylase (carboxylating)